MPSLPTALGLRALPGSLHTPNKAPLYLTLNFIISYLVLAPRHLKQIHGIDHNVSPREDLAKHGAAAVASGKITAKQLAMMKRNEAAQANSVENYTLFVGAIGIASLAGVESHLVNRAGLLYTLARAVYGAVYVFVDSPALSLGRSVAWWVGNGSCLWLLWKAGKKLGAS